MKKITVLLLVLCLALTLFACASPENANGTTVPAGTEAPAKTDAPVGTTEAPVGTTAMPAETDAPAETTAAPVETTAPAETDAPAVEGAEFNVYSLKGPTSMGLVTLLRDSKEGKTVNVYNSTMCAAADEVTAALVNGEADIALLPANAAAALFNKAGGFAVVGINTLGVLYV
ncbi:MAG: ABC transporter substrate-binding protein, partial [Oscillospiraceae bacterium]|nr:ABC transporter substrate-binding protein [Oscillospiraceae bacterium]